MTLDPVLLERFLWLSLSLMLAFFASIVQWIIERPESRYSEQATVWKSTPVIAGILHTLRLCYAVGFPAAIFLWRGALTERGLGIQTRPWNTWAQNIGVTLVVILGMWGLISLGRVSASHASNKRTRYRHHAGVALRESFYHQAHWAFYREPFVLLYGPALGAWLGLLPVLLEAILNPARWADLRTTERGQNLLFRAAQAIGSILLYILTQNLWLMIFADFALGWLLGQAEITKVGEPGLEPAFSLAD